MEEAVLPMEEDRTHHLAAVLPTREDLIHHLIAVLPIEEDLIHHRAAAEVHLLQVVEEVQEGDGREDN